MSNQEDMIEATMTIEEAQAGLKVSEALTRLKANPDFKLVIGDAYIKDSTLNKASLLAIPSMRANREGILEDLVAVSHLQNFLINVERKGSELKTSIDEHLDYIQQLEEAENAPTELKG